MSIEAITTKEFEERQAVVKYLRECEQELTRRNLSSTSKEERNCLKGAAVAIETAADMIELGRHR